MARERETYSDHVRIEVAKERHFTLRVFFVSLFLFLLLGTAISGCTYYSVEQVQHPVKVQNVNSSSYERNN
jgi:hypothetical protein